MVIIRIGDDNVEYPDGSNTNAVLNMLLFGYGRGILKQNGVGVLNEVLPSGEFEYHLTSVGKPNLMDCFLFYLLFIYIISNSVFSSSSRLVLPHYSTPL
jgi:hypothetical protein